MEGPPGAAVSFVECKPMADDVSVCTRTYHDQLDAKVNTVIE